MFKIKVSHLCAKPSRLMNDFIRCHDAKRTRRYTAFLIISQLFLAGFKLSSLNKIIDTKSSVDRRITLLHYILDLLERKVSKTLT